MLGNFLNKAKSVAMRVLGQTGPVLKKVGNFVLTHHQPIAALTNAITSQSDNPYVKNIGSAAVLGSALATRAGIGRSYFNSSPPQ